MRLWTIQPWAAWLQMQETGRLPTDRAYIEPNFLPAYAWLITEMEKRIGPRPAEVEYPVWAWYQWYSQARPKLDLRVERHHNPPGKYARLEIELPDNATVLTDFHLWHYPLNYWYLAESEEAGEVFEAVLEKAGLEHSDKPYPESFHTRVTESWQRIFDLEWQNDYAAAPKASKPIQATFWQLEMNQVKQVTVFEAVNRAGAYEVY